jgi:gamma-glutamyltranspeptidase / glutathione hydrolase
MPNHCKTIASPRRPPRAAWRWRLAILVCSALGLAAGPARAVSPAPVEAAQEMAVSAQRLASQVGADMLRQGGNAVDAAVAMGYALAVVHPCCGNIGGGGFMTVRLADGRETFLDFRETAPLAASKDMFLDAAGAEVPRRSLDGYLAVAVPGTVLGLDTALGRYGTLSRATVMAPAVRLAEEGFVLTQPDIDILRSRNRVFAAEPNLGRIFLKDGKPLQAGDRLVQKALGATLARIARDGPDAFYRGPIADAVVAASRAHGGILSKEDFARYRVSESAPVTCRYRGYDIASAPPPSSGGTTLCEILRILEPTPLHELGFHSAAAMHAMIEAMRHAYVDRNFFLGDPAFVDNPIAHLLSDGHAAAIRAAIDPERATPSQDLAPGKAPHEGASTTHYSVVDRFGNAVAVTYTINQYFGAGVMAGETGFLLNDEMDDFTVKLGTPNFMGLVQGRANAIEPGKRPLSSMAPTIVSRDGKLFLVLGSPGGSRIITILLEAIVNVIDYGMSIQEAIDAPRFHHQWMPDRVSIEPFALSADSAKLLAERGYRLVEQIPWGGAEAILLAPQDAASRPGPASSGNDRARGGKERPGMLYGAADSRQPAGAAIGR